MLTTSDPFLNEVCGAAPFDFYVVDTEHSPTSMVELQTQLIALQCYPSTVLVRASRNETTLIAQVLDLGAEGVVIPHVDSAEQCHEAVAACNYPPAGVRGFGPRRAARVHGGRASYLSAAPDELAVFVQIESVEAVANIDGILSVPRLSGVMVGPADLAASMGHLDSPSHPEVVAAKDKVFEGCAKHDVPFGIFSTGSVAEAAMWLSRGAAMVTIGNELVFMEFGLREATTSIAGLRQTPQERQ
jgi:2-keto-3-deoxy-L-rhamnonate aldolase RhmA